jgi:N-acetylglucosaminyldiphosphoundecaprenol N-acetyl-beta-D-mannosaminyltransferase
MSAAELTKELAPGAVSSTRLGPKYLAFADETTVGRPPVALLGVAFDNLTLRETVNRIEEMIASRCPHHVVTANVDFLVQARRDVELQHILINAPLVLCDGTPLVWASHVFGNPLPERVAGADVVPELIRIAAKKNYRVFFLGTTDEANTRAITKLRTKFPALKVTHYSPPFRPLLEMDDAEIIRRIHAVKPDLLFVAFGCPKAEKWLAMHHRELNVPVSIGVGATIDFLSGHMKRAPLWMQRGGLEWVYRLRQEPRRLFKRYAIDVWHFGMAMAHQWMTANVHTSPRKRGTAASIIQLERAWQRIAPPSCLDRHSITRDAVWWKEIVRTRRHCLLELADTQAIDSTGVAVLLHLKKKLGMVRRQLILVSPSQMVRRVLKAMHLEHVFDIATDALHARAILQAKAQKRRGVNITSKNPLAWWGDVTATNVEQIWQHTWAAIHRANYTTDSLNIDLGAVRFMDSSGVKLLLRVVEIARSHGIHLRFNAPSLAVRNVLRAARQEHLLDSRV